MCFTFIGLICLKIIIIIIIIIELKSLCVGLICCCNFIFGLLRILLGLFLVLFGFSLCYLGFFVLFGSLLCMVNTIILDCLL